MRNLEGRLSFEWLSFLGEGVLSFCLINRPDVLPLLMEYSYAGAVHEPPLRIVFITTQWETKLDRAACAPDPQAGRPPTIDRRPSVFIV
ncbi:MAG TPA: hypothetical protein G4O14_05040 [Anaerolineae bacterium]|nr:hypothetical protein [Anaerolineae bacterium]